jgi:hypothetical protein
MLVKRSAEATRPTHPAADFKLLEQRRRHARRTGRHEDRVERGVIAPAFGAVGIMATTYGARYGLYLILVRSMTGSVKEA